MAEEHFRGHFGAFLSLVTRKCNKYSRTIRIYLGSKKSSEQVRFGEKSVRFGKPVRNKPPKLLSVASLLKSERFIKCSQSVTLTIGLTMRFRHCSQCGDYRFTVPARCLLPGLSLPGIVKLKCDSNETKTNRKIHFSALIVYS
jgi:hypothetical protein